MDERGHSYASAGVDIDAAQRSLRNVTDAVKATYNARTLGGIGGFGAMFSGEFPELTNPVLVSSIDGVGTKTKVAQMAGDYSNLGRDIVNHCVNDILCQGAKPLFFLDYFGCSHLDSEAFESVVIGAAEACAAVDCVLIGGETAEMPGVYTDGEIDIVGTIVGVVDAEQKLPRGIQKPGDRIIGLASNGLHTNGYSLARKVLFDHAGLSVRDPLPGAEDVTIADALLAPHTCYFNAIYPLIQQFPGISAVAHITGGGLTDNLPRVLQYEVQAKIIKRSWTPLPIFEAIQTLGKVDDADMYRTFNMGIGMVIVVDADEAGAVLNALSETGVYAAEIGKLSTGSRDVQIV